MTSLTLVKNGIHYALLLNNSLILDYNHRGLVIADASQYKEYEQLLNVSSPSVGLSIVDVLSETRSGNRYDCLSNNCWTFCLVAFETVRRAVGDVHEHEQDHRP